MKQYEYKGFGIFKVRNNQYEIYYNGIFIRSCKTLKECKDRIDNQTV